MQKSDPQTTRVVGDHPEPAPAGYKRPNQTPEATPRWRALTQLTRAVEKLTAEEIRELAVMAHLMKGKNSNG